MMIRNTLESLVVETPFNEGSRLGCCYFYGSRVEEVADETHFTECTSAYYVYGKGIYVVIKYEDNTIMSAAYLFQYNNCWISMILPLIYLNCDKSRDIDRVYDLVADQYAEIAEDIVSDYVAELRSKYRRLETYDHHYFFRGTHNDNLSCQNYSCKIYDCQPFYHRATGEFGTCMEYIIRDNNILDEWFD